MNPFASGPATATKPAPRLAWALVGLLWLAFLINYVDRQIVFSIFPVLRRELGFSDTQLGLTGSLFIWVYSLAMPFTGRMADLWRRERMILGSLLLWSLATLGTGLSASPGGLLAWRAVMGLTEALYFPAALALIASFHPGTTRSRALAIHATAQFFGIVLGGWFGGWTADTVGWRSGFIMLAVAGVAYAAVLGAVFRRLPAPPADAQAAPAGALSFLRSRCYLALAFAFFTFCLMLWMLYAWLPNWIHERYGLSLAQSGFDGSFYLQAATVAGVLTGGFLGDWAARRAAAGRFYVAGTGLLLSTPFAWLALAAGPLAALKLGCAAFGLLSGLMIANLFASAYDVASERNYGLAAGALNLCGGLAGGASVFVAGLWKHSVGMSALMGWAALASAVGACLLLVAAALAFEGDRRRLAQDASTGLDRFPARGVRQHGRVLK